MPSKLGTQSSLLLHLLSNTLEPWTSGDQWGDQDTEVPVGQCQGKTHHEDQDLPKSAQIFPPESIRTALESSQVFSKACKFHSYGYNSFCLKKKIPDFSEKGERDKERSLIPLALSPTCTTGKTRSC